MKIISYETFARCRADYREVPTAEIRGKDTLPW